MATSTIVLPDPREQPFSGLDLLVRVGLGGRSQIYDRARRGELPVSVFKVGATYRVRTRDVWLLAGLPVPGESELLEVGA